MFVENISDPRLVRAIAKRDRRQDRRRALFRRAVRANGPAATYLDMMRSNLRELTAALAG